MQEPLVPSEAMLWAQFAAAAVSRTESSEYAASYADYLLEEFKKRFEYKPSYSTQGLWQERKK